VADDWRPKEYHFRSDGSAKRKFFEVVSTGVSIREACRIVGTDTGTANTWLNSRPQNMRYKPLPPNEQGRHLNLAERILIADMLVTGATIRGIAEKLDRSPSTISREVRRNRHQVMMRYHPHNAESLAEKRRSRPKPTKVAKNPKLREEIQEFLDQGWSPEQISGHLHMTYADNSSMTAAHETIYRSLYADGNDELQCAARKTLRSGRSRRHRRITKPVRKKRFTAPMVMIKERPAEAEDRKVPGHWEGDLIVGTRSRSAVGTLVERTSRFLMLVHLPFRHTAEAVRDGVTESLLSIPPHMRRSLTWDQGVEMALHSDIMQATGTPVFFCEPSSPWQRGLNENTNGLIRQYLPKSTNLSVHSEKHLTEVAARLNSRPRKALGWRTPEQVFTELAELNLLMPAAAAQPA
jgi:transposase, IS30 family